MQTRLERRRFLIGIAASALATTKATAQEPFPTHAITIVNAFPPGGVNDIVTRPLATGMEPILKQPVVVETKAGAAGQVGAQVVASAKADGYTLLSHNNGISGYAEVDKLFGRPVKTSRADFIPLARLIADPVLLLVNDQQPYRTLAEFIEAAKAYPGTLVFSSGGALWRFASAACLSGKGNRTVEASPLADKRRRAGDHGHSGQQRTGDHPIHLGSAAAHQGR
jgi:tripartite-type tricarboxylate transporter receptor subunit TctC